MKRLNFMTYKWPPEALLRPLTEHDEWPVKEKDCRAIRLESLNVYALRGVSGWERSAERFFFKRYTLHSWLDFNVKCRYAAEQWSNSAVSNEKCPLSLEQEQTWPHRAALAHQISTLFFSRQITRFTNSFILHIMHFESGRLSLHTTIFDFIVRKGVPLIMVMAQQ